MSAPANILAAVKHLTDIEDAKRDTAIGESYDRELKRLVREMDLIGERQDVNAVASQSSYGLGARTIRVMAVTHANVAVNKTTSFTLDCQNDGWMSVAPGTPEVWFADKLDPDIDSISQSAEHVMVRPDPSSSGSGSSGFYFFTSVEPTSQDPEITFVDPVLTYRTVPGIILELPEEMETEEEAVINQGVAKFFVTLADLWIEVIRVRLGL
jgi:hypothetical protein